jgi:hypothetical protein
MRSIELIVDGVQDALVRENFDRLRQALQIDLFGKFVGKHYRIVFTGAVTGYLYPHGLGFAPQDVIQTSFTGAGAITWNYASFTKTNLSITTTGACSVRAFVGSLVET